MIKESSLWRWIKPLPEVVGPKLFLQRIESGLTDAGIPDVFMSYNGIQCWIELKSWSSLSLAQKIWAKKYIKAGGTIYVLYIDKDIKCKMLGELILEDGTREVSIHRVTPLIRPWDILDIVEYRKDH